MVEERFAYREHARSPGEPVRPVTVVKEGPTFEYRAVKMVFFAPPRGQGGDSVFFSHRTVELSYSSSSTWTGRHRGSGCPEKRCSQSRTLSWTVTASTARPSAWPSR